ncbi:hypothetical protein [Anoxybacteroides amylolyticum]|uniref:Uncharacterized protein n=1 Tax=Anoxybacteroides amylolyticum TaxID=294699 RepID=A0A160F2T0_9BACL|nr:hypothetical protein [Anoxybacillus amylolyticus]ANB60567.1 hypothetical protein GFC30_1139 [Anoxybacillus amylolyticus]
MEDDKHIHEQPIDRFSRLMFGSFPLQERTKQLSSSSQPLDLLQLMQDIDTIVSSFYQLKPFVRTISSFIDSLKK